MNGPYRTWQDAHEAVRAARERTGTDGSNLNARMFGEALAGAGVDLGEHDRDILTWLTNYEPTSVAVICGLISRAAAAAALSPGDLQTVLAALDDAREWCTDDDDCGECRATEYGPCESHRWRAKRDASYRRLMGKLAAGGEAPQPGSRVLPDGSVTLAAADHQTMVAALSDAAAYRSQHADEGDLRLVGRYRRLSLSLGDDR